MRQPVAEFKAEHAHVFQTALSLFRNSPHHHQSPAAADQASARTQLSRFLGYKWSELKANSVTLSVFAASLSF
jgi:hypothetical protein